MRIFIDESGTFTSGVYTVPTVSCVAAFIVPESAGDPVLQLQGECLRDWRPPSNELKGRELNERRFNRIFTALGNLDVMVVVVGIDMATETPSILEQHRVEQANRFRKGAAGPEYHPQLKQQVEELAQRLEKLPTQLYVQAMLMSRLLYKTFQMSTLHYVQTQPSTLGSFEWIIDAKDHARTEYELLWSDIVKPILQTMSLREPLLTISDWDYSAMAAFENAVLSEPPEYLKPGIKSREPGPFNSVDIKKVYELTSFKDSQQSEGLQLADVCANAFARACNGRLQERGWHNLGPLMVRDFRRGHYAMEMESFDISKRTSLTTMEYWPVLHELQRNARPWDMNDR